MSPISTLHRMTLPVMESFYTIQGEGYNTGLASYFIRLGGCDVGCVWCDVKESWDATIHPQITIENIVQSALVHPGEAIVVTGGEPFMHDLSSLTQQFTLHGKKMLIETSGAYPVSGHWDWICVSPKKFKPALREVLAVANELKIVIYNKHDFAWAEEHRQWVGSDCKLYLQPEWSKMADIMPLIVDYVKQNPAWKTSLQTHKFMNIP